MAAGHQKSKYQKRNSVVHRLPPQCKLVALIGFVICVVATPAQQFWAFGVFVVLLGAVTVLARISALRVIRGLAIELPFLLFAVTLPFVADGERREIVGIGMSITGLMGAWNIVVKGTLGVAASVLLAATTEPRHILVGAQRLRLPSLLVQITLFMMRYADIVMEQSRRMHIARLARGFQGRTIRQMPVFGRVIAALFIRSYERGERVYLAMASRGYDGRLPAGLVALSTPQQWLAALCLPTAAAITTVIALMNGWEWRNFR